MQKLFLISFLICLINQIGFSQEAHPNTGFSKSDYEYRRKINRRTGNILLGTGAGLFAGGILVANTSSNKTNLENVDGVFTGVIMMGAGIVSSIVSIPFYLTAYNYKIKANAATASFKISAPPIVPGISKTNLPMPVMSLQIPLNSRR